MMLLRRLGIAVCLPLAIWAQTAAIDPAATPRATKPAPAKVDKALRARATEFLQYTLDHSYSKAYELVSTETKDWYLTSGKASFTSFKIESIDYAKDYKEATVHARVNRILSMNGHDTTADIVISDVWKWEGGKWMWYHDPNVLVTPFGEFKIDRSKLSPHAGPAPIPTDTSEAAASKAASNVGVNASTEASTDKKQLLFEEGTPGSDEVVFHNGLTGYVTVDIDVVGDYKSFTVEPKQARVESGKDLKLKVNYSAALHTSPPSVIRLTIEPFQRELTVPLKFKASAVPAAP